MHTLARQCPMGRVPTSTPDLPEDVLALLDHHLLDLGGTYGDPNAGDPVHTMSGDRVVGFQMQMVNDVGAALARLV
jgi:hypothetical protein